MLNYYRGILGGQARVENVEGEWKDLTDKVRLFISRSHCVNTMANILQVNVMAMK